ncbi:hypothetical protein [Portibacter marinus]|uniref:hypothetical protein n=1 Tax=Portibacter marinus TaxID=2898660 RepID=UPI001F34BD87|nr:hypothetical protein [Portibacter marinus]
MKNINFLFYSFLFFFILGIFSCEKGMLEEQHHEITVENTIDKPLNPKDFKFNGNYFEFENSDQFLSLAHQLQDLSRKDFLQFEQEIGYQSVQGDYYRVIEEYAQIETEEELELFFTKNENKVNFVKVEEDFTDVEPLLVHTTKYARMLVGDSRIIKIGDDIMHLTDHRQFIYDQSLLYSLKERIDSDEYGDFEKQAEVYDLAELVQQRNPAVLQEATREVTPGPWYCKRIRVRGRIYYEFFVPGGNTLNPQWTFETKSFRRSGGIWYSTDANNRLTYDFDADITTDQGTTYESFFLNWAVEQDDPLIERTVSMTVPAGNNPGYQLNTDGTSNHRLSRFVNGCDITNLQIEQPLLLSQ